MNTDQTTDLTVPLSPETHAAAVRAAAKLHNIGPDGPGRWAGYVLQAELRRLQGDEERATNWWAEVTIDGRAVLVQGGQVTLLPGGLEGTVLEGTELWTEIADRMLHHGWLVVAHTTDRAVVVRARTGVAIVGGKLIPYVIASAPRGSAQLGTFDEHGNPRSLLEMGKAALDVFGWQDGFLRPVLDVIRSWEQA